MKNSYVGSAVERREDLRFVRGRGQYVDDLAPDGLLHAVILRSSVAHGRIRSIDAAAAPKIAGIHAVITARDMPGGPPRIAMRLQPLPEFKPFEQSVIADTKVRYVGEPIALVLATSMAVGEDALDRIVVDIEPLPAVSDCETSAQGHRLLFPEQGTNCAMTFTAACGDADAAFAIAPYVRREKFRTGRHYGLTMEPRGVMAEWDAATGRLTVSGAAKVPFFNRRILAKLMGLPEDAIAMVENDVGGGFGARGEFYPEDFLIPFAARQVGRPVKWIEDRRENLMAMNHARQARVDVEIACTRDGAILALRGHAHVDMGAYMRTNGAVAARNIAQFMAGPYQVPNIKLKSSLWMTNKTPVGTYRGPGRFETDFFRERLLDMVAKDLHLDRVELRRRNLIPASDMPYRIATITPFESACTRLSIKNNVADKYGTAATFFDSTMPSTQNSTDGSLNFSSGNTVAAATTTFLGQGTVGAAAFLTNQYLSQTHTIVQLIIETTASPGVGQTYTYTVYKNSVATGLTLQTTGAGTFQAVANATTVIEDTANNASYTVQVVTSAAAAAAAHYAQIVFVNR